MTQTDTFPPAVAAVRQQFEDWRAAQTRKGPLPKALWQAAAAHLLRFPLALVARTCPPIQAADAPRPPYCARHFPYRDARPLSR